MCNKGIISPKESGIISIVRVTAMVLIVLCHYSKWYSNIRWIAEFFNVGVSMFFLISGFCMDKRRYNQF